MYNQIMKPKTLLNIAIRDCLSSILDLNSKKGIDLKKIPPYMYGLFLNDRNKDHLKICKTDIQILEKSENWVFETLDVLAYLKTKTKPLGCFFVFVQNTYSEKENDPYFCFILISPNGEKPIVAHINIEELLEFFDFDDIEYVEDSKEFYFLNELKSVLSVEH